MTHDPATAALIADREAILKRIQDQLAKDPDHEVALAMYHADLRRADMALQNHVRHQLPAVRRYSDGKMVLA